MENNIGDKAVNGIGGHICNKFLIPLIHKALAACKRSRPKKGAANTFLANPWYDEECKAAKRTLKENGLNKENKKKYEKLVQTKKENYVNTRRKELISLGKHNPKGFWRELQQKRKQIQNNIRGVQWLDYAKFLYERTQGKNSPPIVNTSMELFTIEDIKQGIKN